MRAALFVASLALAACAGGGPQPRWQLQSHAALEGFKQYYLEGNSRLAERNFAEAKAAVAATGRPELAARAELVRCAMGTAALDAGACARFDAVKNDATADDQAYRAFLSGQWQAQDAARLPSQYRGVASAPDAIARTKAMQQIDDPVSRLFAAGVLFRATQLSPEGLATAVDTASAQGYRRALLAYLNVQAKLADAAGDAAALQSIRRRIDLVYESMPKSN